MNTSACGSGVEPGEPLERQLQPVLGVDGAVLLAAVGEQVDVAQVGDREPGAGYWPYCTAQR